MTLHMQCFSIILVLAEEGLYSLESFSDPREGGGSWETLVYWCLCRPQVVGELGPPQVFRFFSSFNGLLWVGESTLSGSGYPMHLGLYHYR